MKNIIVVAMLGILLINCADDQNDQENTFQEMKNLEKVTDTKDALAREQRNNVVDEDLEN